MKKDIPVGVVKYFLLKNGITIVGAVYATDSITLTIIKLNGDTVVITYDMVTEIKKCKVSKDLRIAVERYTKNLIRLDELKKDNIELKEKIKDLYIKDFWNKDDKE